MLRKALASFPLALWVDADVLLVRDDEDPAVHLHPDCFQALAMEQVPHEHRVNPNTGVWLLRSCPSAFEFLDAVEAAGPQIGPWADQGAVLAALGWDRGDEMYRWAKPGPGNRFTQATSWLPPGWNQPYLPDRIDAELFNGSTASYVGRPDVASPHALHFMGMTPAARHRAMATVVSHAQLTERRRHGDGLITARVGIDAPVCVRGSFTSLGMVGSCLIPTTPSRPPDRARQSTHGSDSANSRTGTPVHTQPGRCKQSCNGTVSRWCDGRSPGRRTGHRLLALAADRSVAVGDDQRVVA